MKSSPCITNENTDLVPASSNGARILQFDFPGLHIGAAQYDEGPTGCTVFHFPNRAACACDLGGGMTGTLMPGDGPVDAICFGGGSLYGLAAATGVSAELFRMYDNKVKDINNIAVVRGAIIYDYTPRPGNTVYPDFRLGRAAMTMARPNLFPMGKAGAGCSASVGKGFEFNMGEPSGQGGAFRRIGESRIAAFCVVNAMGAIIDRNGNIARGHYDRALLRHRHLHDYPDDYFLGLRQDRNGIGNSTLTLIVINERIELDEMKIIAKQVHCSMARAIQPFHLKDDGDVLYVVSTCSIKQKLPIEAIGVIASELVWDAILESIK